MTGDFFARRCPRARLFAAHHHQPQYFGVTTHEERCTNSVDPGPGHRRRLAADGGRRKEGRNKPHDPAEAVLKSLEKAELTADQVAKIKELGAACAEKCKAVQEKAALTPEQKKAGKEAADKAKAEGKKGKELAAAVAEAQKLSEAQKAAMKEEAELHAGLKKEAVALLTAEQKAKADIKEGKKKNK